MYILKKRTRWEWLHLFHAAALQQLRHHYVRLTAVTRKTLRAGLPAVMLVGTAGRASVFWTSFDCRPSPGVKTVDHNFIQVQEYTVRLFTCPALFSCTYSPVYVPIKVCPPYRAKELLGKTGLKKQNMYNLEQQLCDLLTNNGCFSLGLFTNRINALG